jgi:amidohydrolase
MTRSPSLAAPTTPNRTVTLPDNQTWRGLDGSIDNRHPQMVTVRREIHACPEPPGHEQRTTKLLADQLREHGLDPRVMKDGTGIVVDVDLGASNNRFIALRAELDCVNVDDDKTVAYASKNSGLCHACGHDAHATIVLAAVLALNEQRDTLKSLGLTHNIRAVFQPAEENATGARLMVEQGALKNVDSLLAVHVEPFIEPGVIAMRKGPLTSACKSFAIEITGRSGHSARPYEATDPIPAAANLVSLFYQLAPRAMDNRHPLALTVASIHAGSAFNAIPDQATITGTLRASRPQDMDAVQKCMEDVIEGVAKATGCGITVQWPVDAPATNNDEKLIDLMSATAAELLGPEGVRWIDVPSLGAEDFAFFQQHVPGAIVRLGAAVADARGRKPLHSSLFDIDESALAIGAKFLARCAVKAAV